MSTIAAISTAPGVGGIGIVRMSGKEVFSILEKIFLPKNNSPIQGYKIKYGKIINPETKNIVDEVLVSYFVAPKSYTTEDMCEINSHGGIAIVKEILELCLKNGANIAEPGEFTKRAFLNGRIDLCESEAVIDIINAKTKKEARAAANQLEGTLSKKIRSIRKTTISLLSDIEASIDYPEYDVPEVTEKHILQEIQNILEELKKLENSFENGKILKEGIKTAIIGKPNVGKSSLLNAILQEDRAIVTAIEGTTRDIIEETVVIEGIPLKIIDTAGIRETKDEIEQIGIEKSKKIAKEADLVIAILDGEKELSKEDKRILEIIQNKKSIIVLNKKDLPGFNTKILEKIPNNSPIVEISAKEGIGIEKIYEEISKLFQLQQIDVDSGYLVTNIRHKDLIYKAKQQCNKTKQAIYDKMPIDIIAIEITNILKTLGQITGDDVTEDVIKDIFSKFCLGK